MGVQETRMGTRQNQVIGKVMILLIGFLIISVVNIALIVKFIMAIRFKNKDIERAICSPLDNRDDGPPPETVFLIRNKFLALSYKQASIYVSV